MEMTAWQLGLVLPVGAVLVGLAYYGLVRLVTWSHNAGRISSAIDWVVRLVRRPDLATRDRCPECKAGVGVGCVDPYCYGNDQDGLEASKSVARASEVMRVYTRSTQTAWAAERMADVITDLLHLAQRDGVDPFELLDRAGNYFDGERVSA